MPVVVMEVVAAVDVVAGVQVLLLALPVACTAAEERVVEETGVEAVGRAEPARAAVGEEAAAATVAVAAALDLATVKGAVVMALVILEEREAMEEAMAMATVAS